MLRSLYWKILKRQIRAKFPRVKQLSIEELVDRLHSSTPPVLLDSRTEVEYAVSHLANARRIDPKVENLNLNLPADRPIVAYCSVGYRSARLVDRLQRSGYTNVANLEGSIFEWANQGRPVYRGGEIVRQVHPYSQLWGLLLRSNLRLKVE